MKQREGPHDNEKVHRQNGYSFSDANVDQQALVGARTSHRFAAIPTPFAQFRRLMREGCFSAFFSWHPRTYSTIGGAS
jgi:hypothetical protein